MGTALESDGHGIDASLAWDFQTDASSVVVAVIDSGIRATHEDLRDALWSNPDELPGNAIDDDRNGFVDDVHGADFITGSGDSADDNGHGTHVAGIIGATGNNGVGVSGVAWKSQIMALKIIDANGIGITSEAVKAIDYAISEGASLINASWGTDGRSNALETAILRADAAGLFVVAAAGNENRNIDITPTYPAGYGSPNLIAVAATDSDGMLAAFSNWGTQSVMLGAPGTSILSTWASSDDAYRVEGGTSMAAPFVTGTVALLMAEGVDLDRSAIRSRIVRNATFNQFLVGKTLLGASLNAGASLANTVQTEPHDAFETPSNLIQFQVTRTGYPSLASAQTGEPIHGTDSDQGTIWYTWTPSVAAQVALSVVSDLPDAVVAVYTGSQPDELNRISRSFPDQPSVFSALSGVTYRIALSSTRNAALRPSTFTLSARPKNDPFSQAERIAAEPFLLIGSTENATREALEPLSAGGGRTVWWRWTPSESGVYVLTLDVNDLSTSFGLFQSDGLDLTRLVPVAPVGSARFGRRAGAYDLVRGRAYFLQVDSTGNRGAVFTLKGQLARQPVIVSQPPDTQVRPTKALILEVVALGIPPWPISGSSKQQRSRGPPMPG